MNKQEDSFFLTSFSAHKCDILLYYLGIEKLANLINAMHKNCVMSCDSKKVTQICVEVLTLLEC